MPELALIPESRDATRPTETSGMAPDAPPRELPHIEDGVEGVVD